MITVILQLLTFLLYINDYERSMMVVKLSYFSTPIMMPMIPEKKYCLMATSHQARQRLVKGDIMLRVLSEK